MTFAANITGEMNQGSYITLLHEKKKLASGLAHLGKGVEESDLLTWWRNANMQ